MLTLDCRNLACPQPVIRCRDALRASTVTRVEVLVDNEAAVENISAFLRSKGWNVSMQQEDRHFWKVRGEQTEIDAVPTEDTPRQNSPIPAHQPKTLIFIPAATLGQGDEELGTKLMVNFLDTLPEMGSELWRIILVNGGVTLAAIRPAVEKLQTLEKAGISILVCGTCLQHYSLLEQKQVGTTTNMLDIVTSMQLADKVIRL